MGATQSRQDDDKSKKGERTNDSAAITNRVIQNLSRMNDVFQHQKNNNLQELRSYVNNMVRNDKNLEKSLQPLIPQIDAYIQKYDKVFSQNGTSHRARTNATNNELYKYLAAYQDDKLVEVKKNIEEMTKNVIPEGAVIKDLDTMVQNIVNNNTKARFFEYKYIGLNVFMISLLHNLYGSVITFIKDIDEYNKIRMDLQKASARALVEKVKDVVNKNSEIDSNGKPLEVRFEELTKLDGSLEQAIKNIDDWGKQIQERSQQQVKNLQEVLKTLSSFDKEKFDIPRQKDDRFQQYQNAYDYDDDDEFDNSANRMYGGAIRSGTAVYDSYEKAS